MNGDRLYEALSHVGTDLIDRARKTPADDRPKKARHPVVRRLAAITGCACFLLVGAILFARFFPGHGNFSTPGLMLMAVDAAEIDVEKLNETMGFTQWTESNEYCDKNQPEKVHGYFGKTNQAITYTFDKPTFVNGFRLVTDSDLDRENFDGHPDLLTIPMPLFKGLGYNNTSFTFPRTVLKHFRVDVKGKDGTWTTAFETKDNHQRLVRGKIGRECLGIRLMPLSTWGSELKENTYGSATAHIFAFEPT